MGRPKRPARPRAKVRVKGGPRKMNSLERAWAAVLEARQAAGEVQWWAWERVKFRLADGCYYTPDFVAILADGTIEVTETKGFMRDDALVKFKVAAEQFPWATWRMVRRRKGQWETMYEY